MSTNNLTWNEFKLLIDKQLAEKGISGDEEIWYIDISYPDAERVEVNMDKNSGISVYT
jgi:hypothetical protein